ncbi:hypothetical protein SL053_002221 [Flavobacterium psychrophilum]|jgi:hypothetical protein|nr:hypothetical protein [Flavobacterium psychrophilum]ELY2018301.1 hypothetical protein [Flavobacterium psychrophilum]
MSGNNSYTPPNTGSNYNLPEHQLKQSKLNQTHEKSLLTENNKHELEVLEKKNSHEVVLKDKELGWFGLFFGGKELISLNLSGMLLIFLILSGVILSFKIYNKTEDLENILKIWGVITPIITLTLGYIFGNKNGSNNNS